MNQWVCVNERASERAIDAILYFGVLHFHLHSIRTHWRWNRKTHIYLPRRYLVYYYLFLSLIEWTVRRFSSFDAQEIEMSARTIWNKSFGFIGWPSVSVYPFPFRETKVEYPLNVVFHLFTYLIVERMEREPTCFIHQTIRKQFVCLDTGCGLSQTHTHTHLSFTAMTKYYTIKHEVVWARGSHIKLKSKQTKLWSGYSIVSTYICVCVCTSVVSRWMLPCSIHHKFDEIDFKHDRRNFTYF